MFANVIVDISHEKLDKSFEYAVPSELESSIYEGAIVKVPFGKGNRLISAFVTELKETAEFDKDKLKNIDSVVETKVSAEANMIKLAAFIRHNYGGTMNQALKTVIPVKEEITRKRKRIISLVADKETFDNECVQAARKKAVAKLRLLDVFRDNETIPYETATTILKVSSATINALAEKNIIKISDVDYYRNPEFNEKMPSNRVILNEEQRNIVDSIVADMNSGIKKTCLIHGVTGSGKTEVYLSVIEEVVRQGKQVIMLIPEISLTYQTVSRFYERFKDKVSIINSKLSKGERYDQMMRAKRGEISIIIGPRSALFTPFTNLGLIVIDEEHEGSYKSESIPRYHAREVAVERARLDGAFVILGSATPSLEAYYKACNGEYKLYTMKNRTSNSVLPKVYISDLREELKKGNRTIFSEKLKQLMDDRLAKKEQFMLFINRRGHSGFVSCRECGKPIKCPHCDVSLKFHNNNTLVCHYCGYKTAMVKTCPSCGSKYIGTFGTGTQKIEEEIKKLYPSIRTLRMDYDTTQKKDDYERILGSFSNGEADVLIGTQMIVKGHDFPNVTLVGIILADVSLYASDYRAAERTFELLTQAAGRAGRGDKEGEVVIQTYAPDEYSISLSASQDYKSFYDKEINFRSMLSYPPVSNMLVIKAESKYQEACEKQAAKIAEYLKQRMSDIDLIGPTNAPVYKISDIFTNLLYIKSESYEALTRIKDITENYVKDNWDFKYVSVQFDFNPMNL